MNKYIKILGFFLAFLGAQNVASMELDSSHENLEIERDPEVMRLRADLEFIDSEIERIDNKLNNIKSDVTEPACKTEKVKISAVNALNAFLPSQKTFNDSLNSQHTRKLDKLAKFMGKKFEIYGVNNTSGFDFNKKKKQSIAHWIFKDGLNSYHETLSSFNVSTKKISIFRSLRALNIWGGASALEKIDFKGNTPLHYAAKSANCDAVKFLCKLKVNVNAKNEKGTTPLLGLVLRRESIKESVERCIAALSKAGSNVTLSNGLSQSVQKIIDDIIQQKRIINGNSETEKVTCRLKKLIENNRPQREHL